MTRQRQRGGVDGVCEVGLVAGVAGDIDRAAHEQEKRDRHGAEEDEDVASLVAPKPAQGTAKNMRYMDVSPSGTPHARADTRKAAGREGLRTQLTG